jgi:hypothetical protein
VHDDVELTKAIRHVAGDREGLVEEPTVLICDGEPIQREGALRTRVTPFCEGNEDRTVVFQALHGLDQAIAHEVVSCLWLRAERHFGVVVAMSLAYP